jgi:hypothetical protein
MQHPRRVFSTAHPRLPGQAFPGTGMGRQVHDLLVLLCRRIGRDALLNTPERFHLAALYRRVGYRAVVDDDADEVAAGVGVGAAVVDAVVEAGGAAQLSFPQVAWAVERGFVVVDGARYAYTPAPHLCVVSERAERWAKRLPQETKGNAHIVVDVDGLRRSLRDDPVDGVDIPR